MYLPPLVEVPPATIRLSISPEEWTVCLESWVTLSDLYLRLPQAEFQALSVDGSTLVKFVRSFYFECAHAAYTDKTLIDIDGHPLPRACFLLVHRLLTGQNPPISLYEFDFLSNFCKTHDRNSKAISRLLRELWHQPNKLFQTTIEKKKKDLLQTLESKQHPELTDDLYDFMPIVRDSPEVGTMLMTGSDFLDALIQRYTHSEDQGVANGLRDLADNALEQLLHTEPPNISLLSDHLFSLKAAADKSFPRPALARGIARETGFLPGLRKRFANTGNQRINKAIDAMWECRGVWQKAMDTKTKLYRNDEEMHVHRASMITQVQDLFPQLGSGFIEQLLFEYDENVETVIAILLDDALPPHLRNADQGREAEPKKFYSKYPNGNVENLEPRSTPPPQHEPFIPARRNVFDNDEFDRLEIDTSKLHKGKKPAYTTATTTAEEDQTNKAAILSALAAFDSDDDERDDTYDQDDVGGTVDTAHPDGEPPGERDIFTDNDMALFGKYVANPDVFARTAEARKKKERHALKAETRMTDEAIEGWAIMLQRDPRRMRRLEAQYRRFDGKQAEVARTSYREGLEGTETEDSDGPSSRGGFRGGFRGRGRGRGRGGNVAGDNKDPKTGVARDRKEASKGSRANHNRRDQRARKMARGGFAG